MQTSSTPAPGLLCPVRDSGAALWAPMSLLSTPRLRFQAWKQAALTNLILTPNIGPYSSQRSYFSPCAQLPFGDFEASLRFALLVPAFLLQQVNGLAGLAPS